MHQTSFPRPRRQAGVDSLGQQPGVQRRVFQMRFPRFDRRGQGILQPIERGTPILALVRRRLAEITQHPGQAAIASQNRDPYCIPGTQIGRLSQRGVNGGL